MLYLRRGLILPSLQPADIQGSVTRIAGRDRSLCRTVIHTKNCRTHFEPTESSPKPIASQNLFSWQPIVMHCPTYFIFTYFCIPTNYRSWAAVVPSSSASSTGCRHSVQQARHHQPSHIRSPVLRPAMSWKADSARLARKPQFALILSGFLICHKTPLHFLGIYKQYFGFR